MKRPRDRQRSLLYAFERVASGGTHYVPEWQTLEQCSEWLKPVWIAERARYGYPGTDMPLLKRPHWGQSKAIAHHRHEISVPKWARNRWVLLHEAAHILNRGRESHGARFAGILMGLLVRHAGWSVDHLRAVADEMGLRYDMRSIGALPAATETEDEPEVVEPAPTVLHERLALLLPTGDVDAAIELGVHWRQVRGASLKLISAGRARWFRGRLVAVPQQASA